MTDDRRNAIAAIAAIRTADRIASVLRRTR